MPKDPSKYLIPQFILAHFSHHVSTGVLIPLLPLIRESFNLNYFQSGVVISSFSISYGLAQVPVAVYADRLGRLPVIILGLLGVCFTSMAVSLTQDFWQMIPWFIAMGVFGATYHAPASSFISQVLSVEKRGKGLGFHLVGGNASFFLTPAMAVGVATLFQSWRAAFVVLGLPSLLASLLLWFNLRRSADEIEKKSSPSSAAVKESGEKELPSESRISWLEMIRSVGFLVILSVSMFVVAAGVNSYLPLYMVDQHHLSPKLAGILPGIVYAGGMVGGPLGGTLSDALGRRKVILVSIALSGPLFLVVTLTPFGIVLLLFLALYGMAMSMRMPVVESHIADVIPVGRRTTVLGIYFLFSQETQTVTTPFIGYLIDLYGTNPVFISLGLWLCLAAAVGWLFRRAL
jgi:FSR family fosmidomycin resistance protein-like MFS transporter